MARCGVEGLFAGHVHNFWYLNEGATRHYLLPSTSFVRQDYSEMFKAPPALEETEAGRNDAAKLGYFLVHVHERGTSVKWSGPTARAWPRTTRWKRRP